MALEQQSPAGGEVGQAQTNVTGNVTGAERWLSILAGVGLTLAAARRGNPFKRLLYSTAGASLIARGATGYCAMKAALNENKPLSAGLQEQWQRTRRGINQLGTATHLEDVRKRVLGRTTQNIDNMHTLYAMELQELHSAEGQMRALVDEAASLLVHPDIATRLSSYANELRARVIELEGVLSSIGAPARAHPDQAMRALIDETHKMARIAASNVRDAALMSSLQRIIHYKIAGYGTIAAYAKSLGRTEEAGRFASFADDDRRIDEQLSESAKIALNPEASHSPEHVSGMEMRTH
jgi:ferritin-like metal-binding protein YciE